MDEYIHYTARQFKYSDGYFRCTTRRKFNTDGYISDKSKKGYDRYNCKFLVLLLSFA